MDQRRNLNRGETYRMAMKTQHTKTCVLWNRGLAPPPNSYVETLISNVVALGGGPFGGH